MKTEFNVRKSRGIVYLPNILQETRIFILSMFCNEACQCLFLQVAALLAVVIVSAMEDEKREKRHYRPGGWYGGWGGFGDYGYGYGGHGFRPHFPGHGFRPHHPVGVGYFY
jgi:hypothetical protein